jgi:hypothetical protein
MNKYLEKVAKLLSEENKQVAKTFGAQTVAALPAHALGGYLGSKLGDKYLSGAAKATNKVVGRTAGRVGSLGSVGRSASKVVRGLKGLSGKTLGIGLGVSAVGGLADLAALKHGLHGKVKE